MYRYTVFMLCVLSGGVYAQEKRLSFIVSGVLGKVLLSVALPSKRLDDSDWFWNNNFTDGTDHDNDPEREFFRDRTRSTGDPITTDDPRTTDDPPTTYDPPTSDDPTTTEDTTTTEIATTLSNSDIYYKKRKLQALSCTKNEHINLQDEFGCQLCTCDEEGAMLCTKLDCSDQYGIKEETIKQRHLKTLNDAVVHRNLVLREYATGCKQGTAVPTGTCTCSCVLPGVLSCPKSCFSPDDPTTELTTTTDWTTSETTPWTTPDTTEPSTTSQTTKPWTTPETTSSTTRDTTESSTTRETTEPWTTPETTSSTTRDTTEQPTTRETT